METLSIITLVIALSLVTIALVLEKKKANKILAQLNELKGQSEEDLYGRGKFSELGLMSAGITHEISNPLSVISGRVSQLLKHRGSLSPEDITKGLEQIGKNAERIGAIVQSVREYIYRNEDQTEDFIELKDIVCNVLTFCGQRLKNHGIEFRTKNIENIYISGHKGQYEQAILNLVNNSFDAIDKLPEKWIEVSANKDHEVVQIFVRDSGHGIPEEVREKMLDPFYSTKKSKGTGLGLTLVKSIAEKHGGDLKYVEETNTTFMLELPQSSSMHYHH